MPNYKESWRKYSVLINNVFSYHYFKCNVECNNKQLIIRLRARDFCEVIVDEGEARITMASHTNQERVSLLAIYRYLSLSIEEQIASRVNNQITAFA